MDSVKIGIGNLTLKAEIADTFWEKSKGLMFRDPLPEAMFFIFDHPRPLSFWMMFVKHPIDIIFINKEKRVMKIHDSAKPSLNPFGKVYSSEGTAKYVLEVPAGFCRLNSIKKGQEIDFDL